MSTVQRITADQLYNELFWKFPKFLLTNEKYKSLNNNDRVGYMLIRDRLRYSLSNCWIDENGDAYVYYTLDQLQQDLGLSKNTCTAVKKHLKNVGLIETISAGFNPKTKKNEPDKIYICQPNYEFDDFKAITSNTDFPKNGSRSKNRNVDVSATSFEEDSEKAAKTAYLRDFTKSDTNKDKSKLLDTNIDTIIDTGNPAEKAPEHDTWNFNPKKYTQEQIKAQNYDLHKNIDDVLANDTLKAPLNQANIKLLSLWFTDSQSLHDAISTILNAKNKSLETAEKAGVVAYINLDDEELQERIGRTIRRFFNRLRTDDHGIKNPQNYFYVSMLNVFDYWQNEMLRDQNND